MKRFRLVLILVICFMDSYAQQIKVITYNIRYDNAGDGSNQWSLRKNKVEALLHFYSPDILCIQEGLSNQVNDLQKMLSNYFHVGVGRDDGKEKGEFSPIFFKAEKYELLNSGTFWLSPTPEIAGSKGWDAAITRICTWAKIKSKESGKLFFVFNTHFDHIGDTARSESARLILAKVVALSEGLPIFLSGDFNSEPSSGAYQTLVNNSTHPLTDTYIKQGQKDCTFTGFTVNSDICKRIDFIFIDKHFKTRDFKIIDDNDKENYPSDHLPVEALIQLD